jgi:hypothetical protein
VKFDSSSDSVVGIITAVLLIGLIIVVFSIIQSVYVPNWMEGIEADHMDDVTEQFHQIKFAIDLQATLNETDLPISAPISLGNRDLPFLKSSKSYGSIQILNNAAWMNITFNESSLATSILAFGDIKYISSNNYFVNQDFIYECGAIIIGQHNGNIMTVKPAVSAEPSGSNLTITMRFPDINSVGNKEAAAGFGTYAIRVEFNETFTYEYDNTTQILLHTDYPNAWNLYLTSYLTNNLGLIEGIGNDFTTTINGQDLTINFNYEPLRVINLKVSVPYINAQIAPGWIE